MIRPYSLMIVDDSESDRTSYRRWLSQDEHHPYEILEFEDGEEALTACQSHLPDLILLDYRLPTMDGLEFLAALHQQTSQTELPILFLTSFGQTDVAVEAMKRGAQDYVDKNQLNGSKLRTRVQGVLERLRLKQELAWQASCQKLAAQIALRIRQFSELNNILQTAIQEIRDFLQVERVIIYQFAPDWSGTIVAESVLPGWMTSLHALVNDTCFQTEGMNQDYLHGRKRAITDIEKAGLSDCHRELLRRFQVRANLVVPIQLYGPGPTFHGNPLEPCHLWGLLIAHQCSGPRNWGNNELDLLEHISTQVAIAIQQAELQQQLRAELQERKQTEIKLRQSEERYRRLTETIEDVFWLGDPLTGCALYVSPAFEKIWGRSSQPLYENFLTRFDAVHSEDRARVRADFFALPSQHFYEMEYRILRPDGSLRWIRDRGFTVKDCTGRVFQIAGVSEDITSRILTEQSLQESKIKFQQLAENIQDVFWITEIDPIQCVYVSPAFEQIWGRTPGEIYQDFSVFTNSLHPDDRQRVITEIRVSLGRYFECEYRIIRPDGTIRWIYDRGSPMPDSQGNIIFRSGIAQDITNRKQIEIALQHTQQQLEIAYNQLQITINSTIDPIAAVDIQFRLTFLNEAYQNEVEAVIGYRPFVGDCILNVLSQNAPVQAKVKSQWQQALQGECFTITDQYIDPKTGEQNSYELTYSPVRDETGVIIGAVLVVRDIRERLRYEAQLRQMNAELEQRVIDRTAELQTSQQFIQSIMDTSPSLLYIYDLAEGKNIYSNATGMQVLGYTPEEIIALGENFMSTLMHPEERDKNGQHLERLLCAKEGEILEAEYRIRHRNGEWRWLSDRQTVFKASPEGFPQQILGVAQDITERKNLEQELKAREQLLDAFFNAAAEAKVGLGINDSQMRFLKINQALAEINGYPMEKHLGKTMEELIPDLAPQLTPLLQQVQQSGQPIQNLEISGIVPSQPGEIRHWLVSYFPLGEVTDPRSVGTVVIEISDRKRAELALQDLNQRLERSNQELENFAFIASHDLKEPLRTVRNFCSLLQTEYTESFDPIAQDYLMRIDSANQRMQSLIHDLLTLSRIKTTKQPFVQVDLNPVVKMVLADLSQQIQRTGGQIEVGSLPILHADPQQMHQLFQNLISNALKFRRAEPPNVRIYGQLVRSSTQGVYSTFHQIYIEDNGIGFDEQYAGMIFEAFTRLHGRSQYEGTGIGLSICQKIVERHQGTITARSKLNQGSTFIITLPTTHSCATQ